MFITSIGASESDFKIFFLLFVAPGNIKSVISDHQCPTWFKTELGILLSCRRRRLDRFAMTIEVGGLRWNKSSYSRFYALEAEKWVRWKKIVTLAELRGLRLSSQWSLCIFAVRLVSKLMSIYPFFKS